MSEPREKKAPAASPPGGTGKGPAVVSLLFSLLSVGACFLLNAKTSRLEGRLVALEEELAAGRAWSPGEQLGAEPLLALLQPQVDGLLQEKLSEGLAKLRTARDVSSECRCPPGMSSVFKLVCISNNKIMYKLLVPVCNSSSFIVHLYCLVTFNLVLCEILSS
ncbi:collagen alpha-1(XXIII) chain-like isoform X1 [Podarcis muralis]